MKSTCATGVAVLCVLAIAAMAVAQSDGNNQGKVGTAFIPERHPATRLAVANLEVPEGFKVTVFAEGLGKPRMVAVGANGTVYVTRPDHNDVIALKDADNDGRADGAPEPVVSDLPRVHGITIHDGRIYLATVREVLAGTIDADGRVSGLRTIVRGLPEGGQHPNRTLGVGPDGMLYISVGSTCNACVEANPEHATILRVALDGTGRQVYARGLRNTIGFDWHPETGELWGFDNGSDWRGDDQPPEEVNHIREGKHYGWPFCFGKSEPDPFFGTQPEGSSTAEFCRDTAPMTLGYQAHSAPIQMVFYRGDSFPADFRGDAFAAMHGSWNRSQATGYKVVRIRFENGTPAAVEDFVSGFLVAGGKGFIGRPAGIAVGADGALLFTDDSNGMMYHVSRETGITQK